MKNEMTLADAQKAVNQLFESLHLVLDFARQETLKSLDKHLTAEPPASTQSPSNVVPIRRSASGPALEEPPQQAVEQAQPKADKKAAKTDAKLDEQIIKSIGTGKLKLGDILVDMEMAAGAKPNKVVIRKHIKALVDAGKLKTEGEKKGMAYFNPETYVESAQALPAPAVEAAPEPAPAAQPPVKAVRRGASAAPADEDVLVSARLQRMTYEELEKADLSLEEIMAHVGNRLRAEGKRAANTAALQAAVDKLLENGKIGRGEDEHGVFYQAIGAGNADNRTDPAELPTA